MTVDTDTDDQPSSKRSRLFGIYFKDNAVPVATSASSQISKYLELNKDYDETTDVMQFWNSDKTIKEFGKLHNAAIRALSIPAFSSPIERVFSQGGLIARQLRAKMSDTRLSSLIFLKCNCDDI